MNQEMTGMDVLGVNISVLGVTLDKETKNIEIVDDIDSEQNSNF